MFLSDIYIPTSESVDTAWAMSIQGGQLHKGFAAKGTSRSKYAEILVDIVETLLLPRNTAEQEQYRQEQLKPYIHTYGLDPNWLEYCRQRYCERRWFITDKGHIGIGNWVMDDGDVVALLWGLDVACILRPVLGKPDRYTFIGEAYCHGAEMDVQELEKDDAGAFNGVQIVLL
jgi:hypothetical protein